jgi:hypothetical protein
VKDDSSVASNMAARTALAGPGWASVIIS